MTTLLVSMLRGGILVLALVLASAGAVRADAPRERPCGEGLQDWCPAPSGDPCGAHKDRESCKADPRCYGMPFRGESFAPCSYDARGFAANCPTVGCTSTPPRD